MCGQNPEETFFYFSKRKFSFISLFSLVIVINLTKILKKWAKNNVEPYTRILKTYNHKQAQLIQQIHDSVCLQKMSVERVYMFK